MLDADTGKMKRYWGAYGNKPDDADLGKYDPKAPPPQQFRNPVHCVERIERRPGLRVRPPGEPRPGVHAGRQVREGSALREGDARLGLDLGPRVLEGPRSSASSTSPTAPTRRCASSCARRWRRSPTSATAAASPASSTACTASPTDSKGNLYTTETYEGKRLQKFVYKGMGAVRAGDQGVVWPKR